MEIACSTLSLQMNNIQLWYCGCLVFRQNDPFIRHVNAQLQNIASEDAPCLEAVCGGRTQTWSNEKYVVIELP
eukprot:10963403-Karenia_brevis.AAC.1